MGSGCSVCTPAPAAEPQTGSTNREKRLAWESASFDLLQVPEKGTCWRFMILGLPRSGKSSLVHAMAYYCSHPASLAKESRSVAMQDSVVNTPSGVGTAGESRLLQQAISVYQHTSVWVDDGVHGDDVENKIEMVAPMCSPTVGFEEHTFSYGQQLIAFIDTPSQYEARKRAQARAVDMDAVVYVVDSSNIQHFQLARAELDQLVSRRGMRDVPLVIALAKQDREDSAPRARLEEDMLIQSFRHRGEYTVLPVSVVDSISIDRVMRTLSRLCSNAQQYYHR
eukprot:TRINITY_DN85150_c0_g1_i1.p1 TRINITY_DN85150_c0_g1~~TRINITY_DN85150_c0_g1_i1.p1  ORF type:complete len:290 (+),score=107.09 TRINITY_DN85150_c0_g1_i1:28-870(+)